MSRKHLKKNFFAEKYKMFSTFLAFERQNNDFCLEFLAWVPEQNYPCPEEKFDQNYNFLKKTKFLSINADLENEVFWFQL